MGSMEEAGRKRRRRDNIQNAVLSVVTVAGTLAVAAIVPNIFQVLPHIIGKKRYKLSFQARTAIDKLIIKGYMHRIRKNGEVYLELTDVGRRYLQMEEARVQAPAARKRKRWDGRYRLVMFDIPETRKGTRDRLRRLMGEFGFMRLQNSVWVSPYDCEELAMLVKAELRLGSAVLYALVDQIEGERKIKDHFKL